MRFSLLLLVICSTLSADPWGKDADIHYSNCPPKESSGLIKFYQKHISPCSGPQSHHIPSSSEYARQAVAKYGYLQGFLMGCDRLMRENDDPWVYRDAQGPYGILKYDPVP